MISFKYYIKDDISYLLHQYLLNEILHEVVYARNSFMDLVLLFNSEKEKDVLDIVAIAINEDGYREVIGAAEGMKEDKQRWVCFFQ